MCGKWAITNGTPTLTAKHLPSVQIGKLIHSAAHPCFLGTTLDMGLFEFSSLNIDVPMAHLVSNKSCKASMINSALTLNDQVSRATVEIKEMQAQILYWRG